VPRPDEATSARVTTEIGARPVNSLCSTVELVTEITSVLPSSASAALSSPTAGGAGSAAGAASGAATRRKGAPSGARTLRCGSRMRSDIGMWSSAATDALTTAERHEIARYFVVPMTGGHHERMARQRKLRWLAKHNTRSSVWLVS